MSEPTERLRYIGVKIRRPNEYTTWKPRVDRGPGSGSWVWGVLSIQWETELKSEKHERHTGR